MIKMCWFYFLIILIKKQRILLTARKDLGVGGCYLKNPYGVRILNALAIIGRSLSTDEKKILFLFNTSGQVQLQVFHKQQLISHLRAVILKQMKQIVSDDIWCDVMNAM